MNYSTYRISLEIQSIQSQVSLPVTLGDTARRLYINLTDGGKPYVIADGCWASLAAHKADGKNILHDCIIEKNTTIRYDFTEQTASAIGMTECHIMLYGGDGELLASPRFSIVVHDDVVEMDVVSEDDLQSIGRILAGEHERVAAFEEVLADTQEALASSMEATSHASAIANELEEKLNSGYFHGITPHIGENGNWWFGTRDTGVRAEGRDGGGFVPYIGENNNWWIAGEDTGVCAEGIDGITPRIGENGNWWSGNQDTGAYAIGLHCVANSYTGTGTYGSSTPNTLTFDFRPKMVMINHSNPASSNSGDSSATFVNGAMNVICYGSSSSYKVEPLYNTLTDNGDGTYTLSWYTRYTTNADPAARYQLNSSYTQYQYVAIG